MRTATVWMMAVVAMAAGAAQAQPLEARGKIEAVTVYRGQALVTRLVDGVGFSTVGHCAVQQACSRPSLEEAHSLDAPSLLAEGTDFFVLSHRSSSRAVFGYRHELALYKMSSSESRWPAPVCILEVPDTGLATRELGLVATLNGARFEMLYSGYLKRGFMLHGVAEISAKPKRHTLSSSGLRANAQEKGVQLTGGISLDAAGAWVRTPLNDKTIAVLGSFYARDVEMPVALLLLNRKDDSVNVVRGVASGREATVRGAWVTEKTIVAAYREKVSPGSGESHVRTLVLSQRRDGQWAVAAPRKVLSGDAITDQFDVVRTKEGMLLAVVTWAKENPRVVVLRKQEDEGFDVVGYMDMDTPEMPFAFRLNDNASKIGALVRRRVGPECKGEEPKTETVFVEQALEMTPVTRTALAKMQDSEAEAVREKIRVQVEQRKATLTEEQKTRSATLKERLQQNEREAQ